ncbi:MAG: transcription antitermination factor NusB [Aquisalimonadaceae bacterium]
MPEKPRKRRAGKEGNRNPRSLARQRALQALYQWQLGGDSAGNIERQFLPPAEEIPEIPAEPPRMEPDRELEDALTMDGVDADLFRNLLHGVTQRTADWDAQIAPHLTRSIASLDPVERLVLRMGTYELNECLDVPCRVVINECVELGKRFGGEDGYKYINGVLDKVARGNRFRQAEMAGNASGKRKG